jgi:hypothetical protein
MSKSRTRSERLRNAELFSLQALEHLFKLLKTTRYRLYISWWQGQPFDICCIPDNNKTKNIISVSTYTLLSSMRIQP